MTASSNLTAFVSFGRHKAAIVRDDVIKRAMSDQKLNTLKDLKIYQVSTWHTLYYYPPTSEGFTSNNFSKVS